MPTTVETTDLAERESPAIIGTEQRDALIALARNGGNVMRTANEIGMPDSTLWDWRDRNRDEYLRLAAEALPKIEAEQIAEWAGITTLANQVTRRGLERSLEQLDAGDDKMPSVTARNSATTGAILYDKRRLAEERPTTIVRSESVESLIRELDRKALAIPDAEVIDAEAVEE